jgi:carbon-monoxide dehydrogenase large subunit
MSSSVLDKARTLAADHLEAAEEDLSYADGVFSVVGVPDTGISLWELVAEEEVADDEMYVPGAQTFPYGAHVAVVEVSLETGEVRVRKLVAVDDCGTVLNPMIVEGQMHGSLTQGLGQALLEEVRYDPSGQPLTATLMDYLAPRAADLPEPAMDRFETPAPSNPLGAKGSGEAGCIGAPPAVLNAVLDALLPYGVTDLQLPLRPEKVWSALREAGSRG